MLPQAQLAAGIGHREKDFDIQALVAQSAVEALDVSVRTHRQLQRYRRVQEDVSELLILFIHGWDESLNWSSINAHGARTESFSTTREGA
jgi:hypothetical protein